MASSDDPSVVVGIRLDRRIWQRYSDEATSRGKALSTYLRERLEREDEHREELRELRLALADHAPASSEVPPAALLELLLLLRAVAGPQRVQMVQQELARRGMTADDAQDPVRRKPAGSRDS